jgi:hypothetical protein
MDNGVLAIAVKDMLRSTKRLRACTKPDWE